MNISIARQPILNANKEIVAYEILYRGNNYKSNSFDGNNATIEVINHTLLTIGFNDVIDKGRAFFNFTSDLIEQNLPNIFDKDKVVIEVLENVKPKKSILDKMKTLKNDGYVLALDDFVLNYPHSEIIELMDLVKIDFLATNRSERIKIVKRLQKYNVTLLAEKVETHEEFIEAKKIGCQLFQGFFFKRPEILMNEEINTIDSIYLLLLEELSKEYPDYKKLTQLIKKDFSLTYKFLTLVNSVAFYSQTTVESLKQALVRLGLDELNKYIYLLLLKELSVGTPAVVTQTAVIRGKFCELVAKETKYHQESSLFFLAGLLSLIDVILKKNKAEALERLPLLQSIKDGILENEENKFYLSIKLIEHYEKGLFKEAKKYIDKFNINSDLIDDLYLKAIKETKYINQKI